MKKFRFRFWLCFLGSLLLLIVVGCKMIRLVPQHTREYPIPSLTESEKKEIERATKNMKEEEIFRYGINRATNYLHFSRRNDLDSGKANCIGYTAYARQIIDYGLKKNNYSNKTYHYVGILRAFGVNLNKIAYAILPEKDKNFFKDHDFVGIELETGKQILYSPSLYDVFLFGCKTEINGKK